MSWSIWIVRPSLEILVHAPLLELAVTAASILTQRCVAVPGKYYDVGLGEFIYQDGHCIQRIIKLGLGVVTTAWKVHIDKADRLGLAVDDYRKHAVIAIRDRFHG